MTLRRTVVEAYTAAALDSGDVPVLATPRVLALAKQATVAAVGVRVELKHLAPSLVGADLEIEAVLEGWLAGACGSPSICAPSCGR